MSDESRTADLAALKAQKASWQEDGKGLRGDSEIARNTSVGLVFKPSSVFRRPNLDL